MSYIGDRIAERRTALGMSRRVLADLIGSHQTQIVRYEKGENDPTIDVVLRLADALHTSVGWLVGRDGDMEIQLNQIEREAIEVLRSIPPERQTRIVEIMRLAR